LKEFWSQRVLTKKFSEGAKSDDNKASGFGREASRSAERKY